MPTHYCIGNPCWICFPEYAPKTEEKNYSFWKEEIENHLLPENKISGLLEELLIDVFDQGLDEGTHWSSIPEKMTLAQIKEERLKISNDTLEAKLLDRMIRDFEESGHDI